MSKPKTKTGTVTFLTKLLELDGSHEDKLLRITLDGDCGAIGRSIAAFLYEDVEITIRKVPSK